MTRQTYLVFIGPVQLDREAGVAVAISRNGDELHINMANDFASDEELRYFALRWFQSRWASDLTRRKGS